MTLFQESKSSLERRSFARLRTACLPLLAFAPACTMSLADDEGATEAVGETSSAVFAALRFPYSELPLEIKSVGSGKCLDVEGLGTANGSNIQQYTCNGGRNQTFFLSVAGPDSYQLRVGHVGNKNVNVAGGSLDDHANIDISDVANDAQLFGLVKQSDGNYEIVSKRSGKCFDVENASTADNANVQQFGCHGGVNQRWILGVRPKPMNLIAKNSEKCVDVTGGGTANNVSVLQQPCTRNATQTWTLGAATTISGITYNQIVVSSSGKCLDVVGGSIDNLANTVQFTCGTSDSQKWQITENSDGFTTIKNKKSGRCLHVESSSSQNGVHLRQSSCTGASNQRFYWSIVDTRHVQVVQAADSSGAGRLIQSDAAVNAHIARLNGVYGRYGLRLTYDPLVDKSNVNNTGLYNLGSGDTFTCPDGSSGTSFDCAERFASANWPNKVVLISRPGNAFSSGSSSYIAMGQMGTNSNLVCGDVPDTQWLTHEFGHYMGLVHTFFGDGDAISDTRPDSGDPNACLAPHAPTGVAFDGSTVDTNNAMSYYYNANVLVTPMQASQTRAGAYSRGY